MQHVRRIVSLAFWMAFGAVIALVLAPIAFLHTPSTSPTMPNQNQLLAAVASDGVVFESFTVRGLNPTTPFCNPFLECRDGVIKNKSFTIFYSYGKINDSLNIPASHPKAAQFVAHYNELYYAKLEEYTKDFEEECDFVIQNGMPYVGKPSCLSKPWPAFELTEEQLTGIVKDYFTPEIEKKISSY